jgi:16S rRNA (cytosine967-C5)-methyltransferase
MTAARLAAIRVLAALEGGRTTLATEVERERPELADRRDHALFLELAAGATRWRAELDARLAPHLHHPLDELAPELRAILRLAAYQLHHLSRIPAHAIVHESVEAARALRQSKATGFVNGVLRSLVRARRRPDGLPARPPDSGNREAALDYLSITLSHPRWLVARWLDRVGFDACERWCQFNNASPEPAVRPLHEGAAALIARLKDEGVDGSPGRFVAEAVRLPAGSLGRLSPATRRALLIQDEGSQLVASLAGARPGERVLDACAAPGGKTIILAAGVGPGGLVVAGDRRRARVALLRATLANAGVAAPVLALDVEAGLPFLAIFDRVLLDAPCSGLGTIRRDPDIKWRRQPEDLAALAAAQAAMLARAAEAVRPGGELIYATCSSEPEENDEIVDGLLASSSKFAPAPFGAALPGTDAARAIDERGRLRTWPFEHGLDAFFAARLVRREAA